MFYIFCIYAPEETKDTCRLLLSATTAGSHLRQFVLPSLSAVQLSGHDFVGGENLQDI
jgi:hypothetical protein